MLEELGHKQPPTSLQANNTTAIGITTNNVKQRRSKAMDMRFYWIKDRVSQKQFCIYWKPGKYNKVDYFTKYHPVLHHKDILSAYINNEKTASKNYFECLTNSDPAEDPAEDPAQSGDGGGVFMTRSIPDGPFSPTACSHNLS